MAEGAALEMPCRGNSTVGSNPTPSAIYPQHGEAMLTVGETVRAVRWRTLIAMPLPLGMLTVRETVGATR